MSDLEQPEVQEPAAEIDPLDKIYDGMQDNPAPVETAKEPAEPAPKPDDQPKIEKPGGDDGLDEKTLADIKAGKLIPKHRFDEMSERIKVFESFGTPEQLQAALAKLKDMEKLPAAEKREAVEELSPEEQEIRNAMLKMFPYLKDFPKTIEEFSKLKEANETRTKQEQESQQAKEKALFDRGTSKVKELCEKNGLNCASERQLKVHLGGVTDYLHSNPELAARFYANGDVEALITAFDEYYKENFSGFQRKAKAEILNDKQDRDRVPKAPAKGGTPPSSPKLKQSAAEAMDTMAEAFVSASKE